jgi:TonB-linked SusC/RagA family outer membrane protein
MTKFLSTARILAFCISALISIGSTFGQDKKMSGMVSDEEGKPLPGVSVMLKGTTVGVVTDALGKYSLSTPRTGGVLIFSFTGYVQKEVNNISGKQVLNISLSADNKQLTEVVVTAFGVEKNKKALGYSTQIVAGGVLAEARETNVANALKGRVAGLHVNASSGGPGGSSFVIIRGGSSLTGNSQPLYVVDGVPIDNQNLDAATVSGGRDYGDGIGNINPDDIESVTVLKGPAAAALYGSRGSNGVILITSKKGKKRKGVGVDINSNSTFERPNVIPTRQNIWGGGYDGDYNSFGTATVNGQTYSSWPSWLVDDWGGKMDGRLIVVERFPELGPVKYSPQPSDNIKDFFQTGTTFTNTIGVGGGDEKTTYRFSASDMHNKSIIPNTALTRQTFTIRVTSNITSRLTVDAKINYIRQDGKNRPQNNSYSQNPMTGLNLLPRFVDLDWLKNYKNANGGQNTVVSNNPYWVINELIGTDHRDRMIGFLSAKYKFTDWLNLQARSGTDFYTDTRFNRMGQGTNSTHGSVENYQFHVMEDNSDLLLTAAGKLTDKFAGTISVGANHLNKDYQVTGAYGSNVNVDNLYYIGNMRNVTPREYRIRKQINSTYFSGEISYNNYLFLDVTGRNDWSSSLGVDNRSFFYPSFSTSFVFTDALDLRNYLSFGKIRASYAEAGNDADPYSTLGGFDVNSSNTFNGQSTASIRSEIPLYNLKNELKKSYEFGTELRFFDNRLGVDFTYYNSSTTNQIVPIQISTSTGYASRVINAGEISNKGIELFVTGTPLKFKDFKWDISVNFSHNKSKVVSLAPGIPALTILDPGYGASIQARVGEAFGNIVGYRAKRNENGDILVTNDGKYQRADDLSILGRIQPDYLVGVTNTFTYKGFALSALIDVRKGGQILSYSKLNQMAKGTGKFTEKRDNLIINGVVETSPQHYEKNTTVIAASDYYAGGGPWNDIGETQVIDADYIALREATLSYNLSRLLKKGSSFKDLRLSIVGRNLLYFYRDPQFKLMGISPETAFSATTAAQGYEAVSMPTTRSIGVNLSVAF